MYLARSERKAADEVIQSLVESAWPATVLYVVWPYRRQVFKLSATARTRMFTIEVGGQTLSRKEASHQPASLISNLEKRVRDLQQKVEGVTGLCIEYRETRYLRL